MPRRLKTLDDVPLDGKRVLVRVDFNVAVGDDGIVDASEDYRIEAALPTIQELQQRRCRIILLTHRGRPGHEEGDLNLSPITRRLQELLKDDVREVKSLYGDDVNAATAALSPGEIIMLPNVRLDEREEAGSEKFAQDLAEVADVYVNEAFSVSHRAHTSVALIPKFLPSCAGRRTVVEVEVLQRLQSNPQHPYVVIASGAKVSTKVGLLQALLAQADTLCLGGVLANVFLGALGKASFRSLDEGDIAVARSLWEQYEEKILLPLDVIVGPAEGDGDLVTTVSVDAVPADVGGVWDVGPATVKRFLETCQTASTVMWNGPIGMFERSDYAHGTHALAEGLANVPAYRVVGGGDTVHALEEYRLVKKFDHVSVGGGAMMTLLEGKPMPGLEVLYAQ